VGLGAVASPRLLGLWCEASSLSLEARVGSGLAAGAHLAAFRVTLLGGEGAEAGAGLRQTVGVGVSCLPAGPLADAARAGAIAAGFADTPVGGMGKSVGVYSDGTVLAGGVQVAGPAPAAAGADGSDPLMRAGDVVCVVLRPDPPLPGSTAVSLAVSFVMLRTGAVIPGGRILAGSSELVFLAASLSRPPPAASAPSVRLDALFTGTEMVDAGVARRGGEGGAAELAPAMLAAGLTSGAFALDGTWMGAPV